MHGMVQVVTINPSINHQALHRQQRQHYHIPSHLHTHATHHQHALSPPTTTVSKDDATTTHVQCLVVSMNATGLLQGKVAVCDKGWQR
eukprot:m.89202 g.89202  ORF g.89202 m.89202 type:complete len:88 (-) comp12884_c0_seq5:4-267(-)